MAKNNICMKCISLKINKISGQALGFTAVIVLPHLRLEGVVDCCVPAALPCGLLHQCRLLGAHHAHVM